MHLSAYHSALCLIISSSNANHCKIVHVLFWYVLVGMMEFVKEVILFRVQAHFHSQVNSDENVSEVSL